MDDRQAHDIFFAIPFVLLCKKPFDVNGAALNKQNE